MDSGEESRREMPVHPTFFAPEFMPLHPDLETTWRQLQIEESQPRATTKTVQAEVC